MPPVISLYAGALAGSGHTRNLIRYFTALVQPRSDPAQGQRQQVYIRALETLPEVSIHYGAFLSNAVSMPLVQPVGGQNFALVRKTEEKGSDVNLATYLVSDAYEGDFEVAAVISNDSDLVEPIRIVRRKLQIEVGVLCPPTPRGRQPSSELRQVASFQRQISERVLRVCQFPNSLRDARGVITKPALWP